MPDELVPILHVKDGQETARWYARLGFEIEGEHRFAPGMPLYLFLRRGSIALHLSEHTGDARPGTLLYFYVHDVRRGSIALHLSEHTGDARPGTLLYFYVHDVDSIAREFDGEVEDQPWAREVNLTDPDGNRLRIGERKG